MTMRLRERVEHDFPQPGGAQEVQRLASESSDAELGPVADLSPLPEELRCAAGTFANGEVAWPLADAADILDALSAAGRIILGVDIRDFDVDGRFVEIARVDTQITGSSAADREAARACAVAGLGRAAEESWHEPWALITWTAG